MSAVFYVSFALLWVLVVFQGLVLLGVVRTVYRRAGEPASDAPPVSTGALIGQPVPSFTALDLSGRPVDETSLPQTLSALLFVTPDCVTCMASLEEVEALQEKVDGSLIVVCRAGLEECRRLRAAYGLEGTAVVVDEKHEVSERFDVYATPTAVLVGANGRIRTYGHPMDKDELARLMDEGSVFPQFEVTR
jgi:peroxiredoxin